MDAILHLTHVVDDAVLREHEKLRQDAAGLAEVWMVLNETEHARRVELPEHFRVFRFSARDLKALPYPAKERAVRSYNVDLFVITFFLGAPAYDRYWVVEYDMRFSGSWATLLSAFAGNDADLLATTVFRRADCPAWENFRGVSTPGLDPSGWLAAFLPFYRISHRALEALHAAYCAGWAGHCEVTIPSLVAARGWRVEDLGGDGPFTAAENRHRFYRNTPANDDRAPGTLVFRPVRSEPGDEPDMLWHPVKSAPGMITSRRARLLRQMGLLAQRLKALGV